MSIVPIEPESYLEGDWLTWESLLELIPMQAVHYYRKYHRLFVGTEEDLAQSAFLALYALRNAKGGLDRIRELPALDLVHNAMLGEIKANRRESGKLSEQLPEKPQLNDKQKEILAYWRMCASKAARQEGWIMLWLSKVVGWTDAQIADYFYRVKKQYHHEDDIKLIIHRAIVRLKRRMPKDINIDLRLLHFYK